MSRRPRGQGRGNAASPPLDLVFSTLERSLSPEGKTTGQSQRSSQGTIVPFTTKSATGSPKDPFRAETYPPIAPPSDRLKVNSPNVPPPNIEQPRLSNDEDIER